MKWIMLFRHAKSDWALGGNDLDRPISERGRQKTIDIAQRAGDWLRKADWVWCSPAQRTRQTAALVQPFWPKDVDAIEYRDGLYTFDGAALQKQLRLAPQAADALLVFGHNDAITEAANALGHVRIDHVPTSGLVVLALPIDHWKDLAPGRTEAVFFPGMHIDL